MGGLSTAPLTFQNRSEASSFCNQSTKPVNNLNLCGIQPLFYSPLSVFQLENHEALNAKLLSETAIRQTTSPGLQRSNVRGWHSEDDLFERTEPGHQDLCRYIIEAIRICTVKVSPGFDFGQHGIKIEGWVNILSPGGLNSPHDHPGWVWSGCYYIKVPAGDSERSGNIEFIDPRLNVQAATVEGATCFASKFAITPRSGLLLIFPSYLQHWVYPNESEEERVTVAFNARFAKFFRP
jgi:uncharacterized protein (TIGR02466 family)